MMPDPWATYERPSAKEGQATASAPPETNKGTFALTKVFRKGTWRQEAWLTAWLTRKEHAWNLYSRVPNFRFWNKENFEGDFKHRAVYDGKVDVRKLQEWIDEMQPKVRVAERQVETRERKWMETEDFNSQRRRA